MASTIRPNDIVNTDSGDNALMLDVREQFERAKTDIDSISSGDVEVTSIGSTTPRNLEDRFAERVNVLDFGAVGDGVADDTAEIQAAITASAGREVFFPPGTYRITSGLSVVTSGTSIVGVGESTVLLIAFDGYPITLGTSSATGVRDLAVRNIKIAHDTAHTTGASIRTLCVTGVVIDKVVTTGCRTSLEVGSTSVVDSTQQLFLSNCDFSAVSHHCSVWNSGALLNMYATKFNGGGVAGKAAIYKGNTGYNVDGFVIDGCTSENFAQVVASPGGIANMRMTNVLADRCAEIAIDATTASGCVNWRWSIDGSNTFSGPTTSNTAIGFKADMSAGTITDMQICPYLYDFGHEAVLLSGAVADVNLSCIRLESSAYVAGKSAVKLTGTPVRIVMGGAAINCPDADYGVDADSSSSITLGVNAITATSPLNNCTGPVVSTNTYDIYTGGVLSSRVDSSQRVLFGTGGAAFAGVSGNIGRVQMVAPSNAVAAQAFYYGNISTGPLLEGNKSRGASSGEHTVVQSGDILYTIRGVGSDGTNFVPAAQFSVRCAAAPSSGVVPGRAVIETTNLSGTLGEVARFEYEGTCTLGGPQGTEAFRVVPVSSQVNRINVQGSATGAAPRVAAAGADTNIDLLLVPRGTGLVSYGTHSAVGAETITGYISIKDSSGNIRKLAVIS